MSNDYTAGVPKQFYDTPHQQAQADVRKVQVDMSSSQALDAFYKDKTLDSQIRLAALDAAIKTSPDDHGVDQVLYDAEKYLKFLAGQTENVINPLE